MDEMYQRFAETVRAYDMINEGDTVIAGISGGPDSVLMLHFLKKFAERQDFEIRVIHIDHMLRGEEAEKDADFVRQLCNRIDVYSRVAQYPVKDLARQWKTGLEDAGRCVRQQAFAEEKALIKKTKDSIKIALAHNQDDLAETVLHNLARGSGMKGIASMRPKSGEIIRPIIEIEKREVLRYLDKHGIEYRMDRSNDSDIYTRNRIRHHILPLLKQEINVNAAGNIAKTAELCGEAADFLQDEADKLLKKCRKTEEGILLDSAFWMEPAAPRHLALLSAMQMISDRQKNLTYEHVKILENLYELQVGRRADLPYGMEACRIYEGVVLRKRPGIEAKIPETELNIQGITMYGEYTITAKIFRYHGENIVEKKCTKWFDYDKIKGTLKVRSRQSKDTLTIDSDGKKKKVGRILIDGKIPAEMRERVPIIAADQEILWIVGVRMSEAFRIAETTEKVLEITYTGGNENE